jgi:hypothetical protein
VLFGALVTIPNITAALGVATVYSLFFYLLNFYAMRNSANALEIMFVSIAGIFGSIIFVAIAGGGSEIVVRFPFLSAHLTAVVFAAGIVGYFAGLWELGRKLRV